MKKSVRILAVLMVALMLCLTLASCGKKLSGKYSAEALGSGATYEFKGSKVTITVKVLGAEVGSAEGTYEIKDDKITFTFESEDDDVKKYDGTFDFEEKEDSIKIGVLEYEKKD
ncbi:MAG: hypothetical protein IJY47_00065 [Clostridia bacterium]|nr:hypothetical protein [Clostridia bacterium]